MARTPNPRRHALWRDRVSRQSLSGLSVEQFCAKNDAPRSAFYSVEAPNSDLMALLG